MKPHYFALLALFACNKEQAIETDDTEDTEDTEDVDIETTGIIGSVTMVHWPADARYDALGEANALFVADDHGVINLSQCVLGGSFCLDAWPSTETPVDPDVDTDWFADAEKYDAGGAITVGGYTLNREYFNSGRIYYEGDGGEMLTGSGGLEWNGDLAAHAGTEDFVWAGAMTTTAPDATVEHDVGPGDTMDFAWETGGEGDVILRFGGQIYALEDDGAYTLNIDDATWTPPFDDRLVQLGRWTMSEADASGNMVRVLTLSEQWFYLNYADTDGWTELSPTGNCTAAGSADPLVTGNYYGTTDGLANDLDLGDENEWTGYQTRGADAVLPIAVTTGQTVTVHARLMGGLDISIYLMGDCNTISTTTILAAADDVESNAFEDISWVSTVDGTVYLVLDGWDEDAGGDFTVELSVQ